MIKRLTLRISNDEISALEEIAKEEGLIRDNGKINYSKVIRHVIIEYYKGKDTHQLKIPDSITDYIKGIVEDGTAVDYNDAALLLMRYGIERMEEKY